MSRKATSSRPGILIFNDIRNAFPQLSHEQIGALFIAIMDYSAEGITPSFSGSLAMAWAFVRPQLDRSIQSYSASLRQRRYAALCREAKKNGEERISYAEFCRLDDSDDTADIV